MSDHPVGVVLTGGRSSRMGVDKAAIVVDGKPLVVRVADALWEAGCHPVECQGGDSALLAEYGLPGFEDSVADGGPLVAIADGLRRHRGHTVVVAACDLVDLDASAVTAVIDEAPTGVDGSRCDAVVAVAEGRRHLLARFGPEAGERLDELVAGGTVSFLDALDALHTVEVAVDAAAVRNVNTPGDLDGRGSLGPI